MKKESKKEKQKFLHLGVYPETAMRFRKHKVYPRNSDDALLNHILDSFEGKNGKK